MKAYNRYEHKNMWLRMKDAVDLDNLEITPLPERTNWRMPKFIRRQVDKVKKIRFRIRDDKPVKNYRKTKKT